ncbi:hypothetical protein N656DRAFT_379651 [Canariomyces notabilis]|uniref:Secreted protein n=1 Tax=Canariomyces notabilis TaxID=2074819 RepID=A0AAN6YVD6_9PEZI|nr:hypothetical protein N656DRAFT_379651 [Canariomyces arenarius]
MEGQGWRHLFFFFFFSGWGISRPAEKGRQCKELGGLETENQLLWRNRCAVRVQSLSMRGWPVAGGSVEMNLAECHALEWPPGISLGFRLLARLFRGEEGQCAMRAGGSRRGKRADEE